MKKFLLASGAACVLAFGAPSAADAASVVVNVIVNSVPSTAVTCTPVAPLAFPVAAGTAICPITVSPTGWSGTVTLSDTTHFQTDTVGGVLDSGSWGDLAASRDRSRHHYDYSLR